MEYTTYGQGASGRRTTGCSGRRRQIGAPPLIRVFGGLPRSPDVATDDRRHPAGRLFVVSMLCLLAGCPYGADVEPAGHPLPLRPSVVGVWVCDLDDDASWTDLTIGWTQGSTYLLTM